MKSHDAMMTLLDAAKAKGDLDLKIRELINKFEDNRPELAVNEVQLSHINPELINSRVIAVNVDIKLRG